MNPHFIFNCLNSIENFIMLNDQIQASDYLNKFSMLIRSILDSSRNEMLPIVKDMEALRLYVELEQLRFNYKFNYKDFTDPDLIGGDYRVPSLLIQPYVENAIIHGLANSEDEDLNLTVTASLENDRIKFIIQDNGIGRIQSAEYNRLNKSYHKSFGLKITEERINLYKGGHKTDSSIKITDLYDEFKNPAGTKVEITIKAN
jgi:sensor histidine kinase YesM